MTPLEAVRQALEIDWQRRCQFFVAKAAIAIHNEPPATAEHEARMALAELILENLEGYAARFAIGAATNPTILAETSLADVADNDLEFTINSIYNSYTQGLSLTEVVTPVVIPATLTRPANTTAYAAGDEVTDVGGAILTFSGCARLAGGSGILDSITIIDGANAATDPQLDAFVFDTTSTPQADNAAFAPSDAVMNTLVGAVSMGTAIAGDSGASGNLLFQQRNLCLPFVCGPGSTSLFARLVARNAYTPTSGEVFTVRLGVRQF